MADNQFESMRGDIADMRALLNIVSADEHVPEIEQYNRTIKGPLRGIYNTLPFKYLSPFFVIEMVYACIFWYNMFALRGGISDTQSPSEIVLNRPVDFNAHCKIEFGDYVQTHEDHDNSMAPRTMGAIATCPTGNIQGATILSVLTQTTKLTDVTGHPYLYLMKSFSRSIALHVVPSLINLTFISPISTMRTLTSYMPT